MEITKGTSDWIKLIFVFLIFNFHFMVTFNGLSIGQAFGEIYFPIARGDVAVAGFFFLSGYALWNNPKNTERGFYSLVARKNFQILFPLSVAVMLALVMIYRGFGNYALKASELGYGWNLVVPYGMMKDTTPISVILLQLKEMLLYRSDVFALSGWFVAPLLSMWNSLAVFMLYFKDKLSKDLVFFVLFLCLVVEVSSPATKGLLLCFLTGVVLAAQKEKIAHVIENKIKPFVGVMWVPALVLLFGLSAALVWMVKGKTIILAHIYNYHLVPVIYFVKELPYFSTLPLILFTLFFIAKITKGKSNRIFEFISPYFYPFIIIHYFVFGVLINWMHYKLSILHLYQVYMAALAGSIFLAFVLGKITMLLSGLLFKERSKKQSANEVKEVAA